MDDEKKVWGLHIFEDAPDWAQYAAVDENGKGYLFQNEPALRGPEWNVAHGVHLIIGRFEKTLLGVVQDWKKSLLSRADYEAMMKAAPKETPLEKRDRLKAQLAQVEAEIEAQRIADIKPGTIVWAWNDDYDERDALLNILKNVNGPKSYTCQYNESGDTECYDNIKVHSMPPSKEDLSKAFYSGWDNYRRAINGELHVCVDKWIKQNFPEAI